MPIISNLLDRVSDKIGQLLQERQLRKNVRWPVRECHCTAHDVQGSETHHRDCPFYGE